MTKTSYRDACFRCPKAYADETDSSEEDEEEEVKDKEKSRDSYGSAPAARDQLKYNLIACKQMVGIFVTVWVKKELVQHIGHLRKSCIGRGILGCLGNKVRTESNCCYPASNYSIPDCTSAAAGMYISKHDTAPDELLFRLQPFGFRPERR
jgi:hypothetical protein